MAAVTDRDAIPTTTLERWLRILIDAGETAQAEALRREISRREA